MASTSNFHVIQPELQESSMKYKTQKITTFFDRITEEEQSELEKNMAKAIYHSGMALSAFETPYWKTFFKSLRPKFVVPSPYKLSNSLLNVEYKRVMDDVNDKINKATCLALLTDGWTNITGDGVINFVITTPEPVFYKSIIPGQERETSEYIKTQIANVLDEVGQEKFFLICTDNAAAMKGAWAKLKEIDKYKHIHSVGCLAHGLNLLFKDLCAIPTISKLLLKVKQIVKNFKNTHILQSTFKNIQKKIYGNTSVSLKLPSNTRWAGGILMMESVKKNQQALKETSVAVGLEKTIDKEVKQCILDDDLFWPQVDSILSILLPISIGISAAESDETRLSDAHEIFARIESQLCEHLRMSCLNNVEIKTIKTVFSSRKAFCLYPVHCASNLLDPRYKGKTLTAVEVSEAIHIINCIADWLKIDQGSILSCLAEYRTGTGFFGLVSNINLTCPPAIWWQGIASNEPLCPIASRLLSVPCSSAACERNWSSFGLIHTKLRNKLLSGRVEKLVAIRSNLNIGQRGHSKKKIHKSIVTPNFEEENEEELNLSDCSLDSTDSINELYNLASKA